MDTKNDFKIKLNFPTRKRPHDEDEEDEIDEELLNDQLQILINQINFQDESGSYPKRLSALQSFLHYIEKCTIPPNFMAMLQKSILDIIQQENSTEIDEVTLLIIYATYKTFDDDTTVNYQDLVQFVWKMLPSELAFDTLALLAYQHVGAAKVIVQQKDKILEWLDDEEYVHNTLNLLSGLTKKREIQSDLVPFINKKFLNMTQILDTDNLKIMYSILMHLTDKNEGLTCILDYGMLGNLFDKALENREIFYSALCFVEKINNEVKDPMSFMERANVLDFFEKSLDDTDPKIFKEGLNLCLSIAEDTSGIQFLIEKGIVDKIFNLLNSSTLEISSLAMQIICSIISECPAEAIPQFVERNIVENISLYLPAAERRSQFEMLKCLQTIVITFQQSGNTEFIQEMATKDLEEALSDLKSLNSENDSTLQAVAHRVYRMIFPDE